MINLEDELDNLPKVKNVRHRNVLMDFADGMNPVEAYYKEYGTDMKKTSAKSSVSTIINDIDNEEFLNAYQDLKLKIKLKSEMDIVAELLDPVKILADLKETAEITKWRNPAVSRDTNIKLLELSGTANLIESIVRKSLESKGYIYGDDEKRARDERDEGEVD